MKMYKLTPCDKPTCRLTFNGEIKEHGKVLKQYLGGEPVNAYNTDGEKWWRVDIDWAWVRKNKLDKAKGGSKSKRAITPEQQADLQKARKKKKRSVRLSNIPSSATPQAGLEPRKRNGGEQ